MPVSVGGFAELAVRAWLAAGEQSAAGLDAVFVNRPDLPPETLGQWAVGGVTTVAARPGGDRYWAVTVAADVGPRDRDSLPHPAGPLFFEIGVVQDDEGSLVAVGGPAMVPAPTSAGLTTRPAGPALGDPDPHDPMTATLAGFFEALLTGVGDVSRYLAPDVTLTAITPVPFTEATVSGQAVDHLGDGEARARARVRAVGTDDVTWTLGYELMLAERDGRWEIRSLSGAPTLAEAGEPSTSTSSPPSPDTSVPVASEPGA